MQLIADDAVFWRFQGEWVEFFKSDLTDPPSDFWCASLGKYRLRPFQISFSVGFIWRSCFELDGFIAYSNESDWREEERTFIHTSQPLITSFYMIKRTYFFIYRIYGSRICWNSLYDLLNEKLGTPQHISSKIPHPGTSLTNFEATRFLKWALL